jgi:hypothetical protein
LGVLNGVGVTRSPGKKVTVMSALSIATVDPGKYIHWGVIQISVANLAIILVMILVFILALVVPFPTHDAQDEQDGPGR